MCSEFDDTMELPRINGTEMPETYGEFLKLDVYENDPVDVAPVRNLYQKEDRNGISE